MVELQFLERREILGRQIPGLLEMVIDTKI